MPKVQPTVTSTSSSHVLYHVTVVYWRWRCLSAVLAVSSIQDFEGMHTRLVVLLVDSGLCKKIKKYKINKKRQGLRVRCSLLSHH